MDKLKERITCLESAPVKDADNMVAQQEGTSFDEPADTSDHISVVVEPDHIDIVMVQ